MKNRKIKLKLTFKEKGTFQSMYAAESWLSKNGYSYGSTCVFEPVAIVKGEYNLPQKWYNLTQEQKINVDGIMQSGNWREGAVEIIIYE